ncbi:hypothetical protein PC116_g14767 [Phytophthora cactorum]|nr:hypothetical protein Pcac1_g26810 [Phytophthora cactorum]KAG3014598.1 hypothetical protein PC120_g12597 [Phytophthora cactorum]KAG3096167.1 hypothetical protein PI125_g16038 [Phytophthora idaei]KAG3160357.1 hypothetical protein PI126_g6940 [Phytophthora idaei]KAG4237149.1 hypothetical protein PC116_g14767 [Phytophthora cactorum]
MVFAGRASRQRSRVAFALSSSVTCSPGGSMTSVQLKTAYA